MRAAPRSVAAPLGIANLLVSLQIFAIFSRTGSLQTEDTRLQAELSLYGVDRAIRLLLATEMTAMLDEATTSSRHVRMHATFVLCMRARPLFVAPQ